jgi:hypothetical protein
MEASEPYGSPAMAADVAYSNERERMRRAWNAAVAAHQAAPTDATAARVAQIKDKFLQLISLHIMEDDRYQERTH